MEGAGRRIRLQLCRKHLSSAMSLIRPDFVGLRSPARGRREARPVDSFSRKRENVALSEGRMRAGRAREARSRARFEFPPLTLSRGRRGAIFELPALFVGEEEGELRAQLPFRAFIGPHDIVERLQ